GRRRRAPGRRAGGRRGAQRRQEAAPGSGVVMRRWRPSALDLKLIRDLAAMRTQALAIALVIAAGIAMFVAYLSNFDSLDRARADYYLRQRFADVFAGVRRAPEGLAARVAELPGVERRSEERRVGKACRVRRR